MKDKHLDDIIREKLESLYVPAQPGAWERFEQRLDAEDSGAPAPREADLDEAVFNKLHQLRRPYRSDAWTRMAERLDREFVRPEQVLRYKAMELTLILLTALTLWQFMPLSPGAEAEVRIAASVETGPVTSGAPASPSLFDAATDSRQEIGENPGEPTAAGEETTYSGAETGRSGAAPADAGADHEPRQLAPIPGFPAAPLPEKTAQLSVSNMNPPVVRRDAGPAAALPPATMPHLSESMPYGEFSGEATPLSPTRYLFFGMFGGPEYNRIITPPDYFLDVETNEFDRYELGYSGGISVGLGLGDWEVQSGFIYTAKEYPSINLLLRHGNSRDGYTVEQFKDVQLNILQVPLSLRYNLVHRDRWRVYTIAGASLNVATHANYFIDKAGSRRSVLSERIENGWLEGGTFRENSFLTGNLGFGFERFVTGRWSFFAQPTYQHTLYSFNRGFGPTNDRLNTLSIYTGIRIRMKR